MTLQSIALRICEEFNLDPNQDYGDDVTLAEAMIDRGELECRAAMSAVACKAILTPKETQHG